MKAAYTVGPWRVEFTNNGYPAAIFAINADNKKAGAVGKNITRPRSIMLPSSAEGYSNARLMAAGPELIECLEDLIEQAVMCVERNDFETLRQACVRADDLVQRVKGAS